MHNPGYYLSSRDSARATSLQSCRTGPIQHVGFVGIDDARLFRGHFGRNQVLFDRVGMDAVVDFGQFAFGTPAELFLFLFFQPLELFDDIQLEFYGNPARKFERNILMSIGSSVTPRFGNDTDGIGRIDPLLRRQGKGIQSGLLSKPLEFEGFEIRIIQAFPNSEIFDRIPIAQLIADHRIRVVALVSRDVRQTDIVVLIEQYNCNICVPYRNLCHICIVFFTANIL